MCSVEARRKTPVVAPPSTCISLNRRPFTSTSMGTVGKKPGTDAEARRMDRYSSLASGRPLEAMAPMSQTTSRRVSIFVVPTYSRRPAAWAETDFREDGIGRLGGNQFLSGVESAAESDHSTADGRRRR